ncbi:hypothetical protein DAPPUDRAFT_253364 [Daphnia pulex]|uniref:Uncharacterized protein n=1 Tax=Daphnia pulex TaxID=6669 RepID=E9H4N6_DAPPU|nr:hypothetical protein DAPPUDRAFT_253364 [Daphnia pulex]|eukprot:EFX73178.1 hypothetical protein DAPPUDRAFT_253364 [Daphnia pulex]
MLVQVVLTALPCVMSLKLLGIILLPGRTLAAVEQSKRLYLRLRIAYKPCQKCEQMNNSSFSNPDADVVINPDGEVYNPIDLKDYTFLMIS